MYKAPSNKHTYWETIDSYWDDIYHIIQVYLPTFHKQWIDNTPLDITLGEYLLDLKAKRHPRLIRAISATWWRLPEDTTHIGSDYNIGINVIYDIIRLEDQCLNEIGE